MAVRFEIKLSENKQFYFVLISGNNEVIAMSEMYTTKAMCKNGIAAVKRDAPNAPILDTTI